MQIVIDRKKFEDKQTLGRLSVIDKGERLFGCHTLELPWKDNRRCVSCIPAGEYQVKKRVSKKFGEHFHITNVKDRSFILIHKGNYHTQILGCVLVGVGLKDINGDGYRDVTNSTGALNRLLRILPNEFPLTINN